MGLQIRDDRQMKALTGLSQAQFAHLLPVFSDIYQTTQQQTYEKGVESGTRTRTPGGGSKGKLPTLADKLLFVLYYYKTYPTFDVLWTQFDMVRSKAHENLHKLSPILYDTLVHLELMPYRELATPEDLKAALQGVDRLIIDATGGGHKRLYNQLRQWLLSWSVHVLSWADAPNLNRLIIRYEDMKCHSCTTFHTIAAFLQLPTEAAQIAQALHHCDFPRLQQQEAAHGFQEKAARAESFFRKGIVGDWQHGLSPTQIKTIIDQHGDVMQRFGYLDAHGQPITHFDQPETWR